MNADGVGDSVPRCDRCGHMPHDEIGFCPNMASDNDCSCKGSSAKSDGVGDRALADVIGERERQISKGYTPEHDDEHTLSHILGHCGLNWHPPHYSPADAERTRAAMVRMAAGLLAGIELLDRRDDAGEASS